MELQLRSTEPVQCPITGFYLAGEVVAVWLERLCDAGCGEAGTRIAAVPGGAWVTLANGIEPNHAIGLPLRSLAGCLYLPRDAVLHPPVTDSEIRAMAGDGLLFFHPTRGLDRIAPEALRPIAQWLQVPLESEMEWNGAQPGPEPPPGLRQILVPIPPGDLGSMFAREGDEIGNPNGEPLPKAPGEPADNPLANASRKAMRAFTEKLARLGKGGRAGGGARGPGWTDKLSEWAGERFASLTRDLDVLRHKEIHRLLQLFDTDPEKGLRQAIPMNPFGNRGQAPPGVHLGDRPLDFDVSRLGGEAADSWSIPPELQAALSRRYREMAAREAELGRYRRAAYIYAQLLGDLSSAANVLELGGHHLEAAVLYRDHLQNPLAAAKCLAAAGQLPEAIALYETHGEWETAAGLHERMGDREGARAMWRRAVEAALERENRLEAAGYLLARLDARREALDLLFDAWPDHPSAFVCLERGFELLAEQEEHEEARSRLAMVLERGESQPRVPLLQFLGWVQETYPEPGIRQKATHGVQRTVAQRLSESGVEEREARGLLRFVRELRREDQLLKRDVERFCDELGEGMRRKASATKTTVARAARLIRTWALPQQTEWRHLVRHRHWVFAVGFDGDELCCVRGIWEGLVQGMRWPVPGVQRHPGIILESAGENAGMMVLAVQGQPPLLRKTLPASDQFFGKPCMIGGVPWLGSEVWPFAFGPQCVWGLMNPPIVPCLLTCHDKQGRLLRTEEWEELPEEVLEGGSEPLMTTVGNTVVLAMGDRLLWMPVQGERVSVQLPSEVIGLTPTLSHARGGVVVRMWRGAVLIWLNQPEHWIELDRDAGFSGATFVPAGPLVMTSGITIRMIQIRNGEVGKVETFDAQENRPPIAVTHTGEPGQFATLDGGGLVRVYGN